ncbi:MAG: amidohydrolase family protein [Myxococcota bacterium]
MRALRPTWAWTPDGLVRAPVVAVDDAGRIVPSEGLPVEDVPGLLLPGLVNAHTHLEFGPTPTAREGGFLNWLAQIRAGEPPSAAQAGRGVFQSIKAGTAAVGEITNGGLSAGALAAGKMPARVFHEVYGIDVEDPPKLAALTPHAPHTTHPNVIRAAAARGTPWSIHFDEDPEEAVFLRTGGGPWPVAMRRMGRNLASFRVPGCSPAEYLAGLGVLDRRALLVHATCTRGEDLDRVAVARVCLCVRSNLHITGWLPDVRGLLAREVPLAIGTDSLSSSPDLDLVAEAVALRRAFADVPLAVWMRALTEGGADALDLPLGRIREGEAPGLLLVDVPAGDDPLERLFDGTRWRRRWISCPAS